MNPSSASCSRPRPGRDENRVDAAQLAEERDGLGAGRDPVQQRAAACGGTGESDGLDQRVVHEGLAGLPPGHQRKQARRRTGTFQRGGDHLRRPGSKFAVRVVRLVHHGTARGECGRCVTAHHAEREGEVGGTEDSDHTERHVVPAQVGPGTHAPAGVVVVDGGVEVLTPADLVRKEPQLEHCALQLANQPRFRQVRLPDGGLHELRGGLLESVANGLEPAGAGARVRQAAFFEGVLRGFHGGAQFRGSRGFSADDGGLGLGGHRLAPAVLKDPPVTAARLPTSCQPAPPGNSQRAREAVSISAPVPGSSGAA